MEEIYKWIDKLSGSDARSLLFHVMYRIKSIQGSDQLLEEQLEEIFRLYETILTVNEKQVEREYKSAHIVCGESAAGSLRVGLGHENKVIGFPDFFAVGPIYELHHEVGRKNRYEWLRDHLNYPDDYFEEEYESRFSKTLAEIDMIRDEIPIVIWTAENANEQVGVRYLLYLLKEKKNDIFLINSTLSYQDLFNTSEFQYDCFHTGEMVPEKLQTIYEKKRGEPLTGEERTHLENEWLILSSQKEMLRIWENSRMKAVDEDYFDEFIVTSARNLHQGENDFIKAGRLIGEVYGIIDNNVGDAFLEYRLRNLIYSGVFEIKGIPKGMRYYSVKLR